MKKDTEPHPVKLSLYPSGVMLCCFETWTTTIVTENEGDTLLCKHCGNRLIVKNHLWQWDSSYEPEEKE